MPKKDFYFFFRSRSLFSRLGSPATRPFSFIIMSLERVQTRVISLRVTSGKPATSEHSSDPFLCLRQWTAINVCILGRKMLLNMIYDSIKGCKRKLFFETFFYCQLRLFFYLTCSKVKLSVLIFFPFSFILLTFHGRFCELIFNFIPFSIFITTHHNKTLSLSFCP